MDQDAASTDEKVKQLQAAFDAFMEQMRSLESERLKVMKRVIGTLEQEEIKSLLNELKK